MSDYTILIKKHNYYDASRYSESSSESEVDSISDISLSGHELQLKEVVVTSEFNQDFNIYNNDKFDNEDYNESYPSDKDDYSSVNNYDEENCFDHNKSSFKELSFVCTVKGCSKKYAIKDSLERHIWHHHTGRNSFFCLEPQCTNIKFSTNDLLKRHQQKVHADQVFYVCREGCDEKHDTVRTQKQINSVQIRVHPDGETQKIHRCNEPGCDKFFTNSYDLWNHARFGHLKEIIERIHKCEELGCNRSFDTLYGLWVHKRSHIRETPELDRTLKYDEIKIYARKYPCKVPGCNRIFDSKSAVASHKRIHKIRKDDQEISSIKKCDVPECDKIFEGHLHLEKNKIYEESGNFQNSQQQQMHTNDKLVQVEINYDVQDKTNQFEALKQHLNADHNMKKYYYICDKEGCDFSCTDGSNFYKHQQIHDVATIHSKEVLFKCEKFKCDKVFKRLCHLRFHQNRSGHRQTMRFINQLKSSSKLDKKYCEKKGDGDYACSEPGCDKVFKRLCHLRFHQNRSKHYQTSTMLIKLDNHVKRGDGNYACNEPGCDKVFKRLCHLRFHQNRSKHYQTSTMLTNQQKTSFKVDEDYHVKKGDGDYACNEPGCDKVFKRLCHLRKHKNYRHIKTSVLPYVYIENVNLEIKQESTYYCDYPGCLYTTRQVIDFTRHKVTHIEEKPFSCSNTSTGDEIHASDNPIMKSASYNLRRYNKISFKKNQDLIGTKINYSLIRTKPRFRIHPRLNQHVCNHQGCNKKFVTLKSLKKHKNRVHSKDTLKNVQIPITDFVNKKRLSISYDKSKGDKYHYGLRKRPRINKINILDDDDDDCLCKFTGCRKHFDSIRSLKIHQQRFHMITKTYSCNKTGCNFRTKFFEKLERHRVEKHRIS